MQWIYRRPVVAGYWWWQRDDSTSPTVLKVSCDQAGNWSCKTIYDHRMTGEGGRWSGPITPPNGFAPWSNGQDRPD